MDAHKCFECGADLVTLCPACNETPTMARISLDKEIQNLRDHCNREIERINKGAGANTPGFEITNGWLKRCDKIFHAAEQSTETEAK